MSQASRALARSIRIREWRSLMAWVIGTVFLVAYTAIAFEQLFEGSAELEALRPMLESPAAIVFTGPGYGSDTLTTGVMVAWELLAYTAMLHAIMSVLMVVRLTRGDEESGFGEWVGMAALPRRASLIGALIAAVVANAALGGVEWTTLVAVQLGAYDSAVYAGGGIMVGLVFAGIAGLLVSLAPSARSARGLGVAGVVAAFVLRGLGDVQEVHGGWLSWTSPIGWAQQARAWAEPRWWPIVLGMGVALALAACALVFDGRRDLASGLITGPDLSGPARPGPRTVFGMAWHLLGVSIVWWSIGAVALAGVYGSMAQSIVDSLSELILSNPIITEYLSAGRGQITADSFMALISRYGGLLAGAFAVSAVGVLGAEERSGRADVVLSAPVARRTWQLSIVGAAALGSGAVLLTSGIAQGLSVGASLGDFSGLWTSIGATMVYWPAALMCVGLSALAHSFSPRVSGLVWGVFGFWAFLVVMGRLADLPTVVLDSSPYIHVPELPGIPVDTEHWVALGVMVLIAIMSVGVAMWCVEGRDID